MINWKDIQKRAANTPSNESFTMPQPTKEEQNQWQTSLLVSSMAIDSRYVAISRKDLELFRAGLIRRYWNGSDELGKRILSFDPEKEEKGVYLYAEPGLGKTSILKTLAIRLAKQFTFLNIFFRADYLGITLRFGG